MLVSAQKITEFTIKNKNKVMATIWYIMRPIIGRCEWCYTKPFKILKLIICSLTKCLKDKYMT